MKKYRKNFQTYILMLAIFGTLIYCALNFGEKFSHTAILQATTGISNTAFGMFQNIIINNLTHPLTVLLFQIIVILIAVRIFSHIFKLIGQPGVIGEIVAGIVLGPSLLGYFFPDFFHTLFPVNSLTNLELLSQIGLVLFMFVIGMEVDFTILKNKINETLVISHAGIIVPFFLGIISSFWIYEEYAAQQTDFLPFALFIGISMSITAFPVLARIIQERNMTNTPVGILSIASAANDDVTAWCLLAIVIAVAKAGTFLSALYTIGLTLAFIAIMFWLVRPFLRKIGDLYANSEVINKSFVGFIFLVMIISSVITEIIGIHALFGAFIAGVVMPVNTGFRTVMMEKVEDIALVFFLPLFFAFTGLRTEIGLINTPELWGICALLISIAILGKLGGCTIAARLVGESWKDSLIIGTLMNTRGLMELIALNIGYEMGILPPEIFVILVLMALSTTFMTTPLLNLTEKIFKDKPSYESKKSKILLSFGRAESGKILLSLTGLLFGKHPKNTEIIAAHYTVGGDLNPGKASQYAKESFKPLEKVAADLHLQVDKRYKVTDRLTREMIQLANREKANLILVCAGPQFMESNISAPDNDNSYPSFIHRLGEQIHNRTFRLAGNLSKDKLHQLIENVSSPVGVFVDRSETKPCQLYLLLNGEQDFPLLEYIHLMRIDQDAGIRICLSDETVSPSGIEQQLATLNKDSQPTFILTPPLNKNGEIYSPGNLIIMSNTTCRELAHNTTLFSLLPSMLVIYKK